MKVLFFTQNLARIGSEIALYNIICNADRQQIKMAVAVGEAGELTEHLPPDVPWSVYMRNDSPSLVQKIGRRVKEKFSSKEPEEWLADLAHDYEGYIWYINSIVQPYILRQARKFGVPCVVHSHEMEQMFWNLSEQDARNIVEYPKLVIACSHSAAEVLRQLGRKENLEVCHEPVEVKNVVSTAEKRETLRRQLGVDKDKFVWAMSGSLDPNKNPSLFVELAHEMSRKGHKVHFIWLGSGLDKGYALFVQGKARFLNVDRMVSWLGARSDDYYDYLNMADGLVLTSFKESFSIVSVESAYLGKPVVAFNCGGVKEIVNEGMGMVIDSWNRSDLIAVMEKVMKGELYFDPSVAHEYALKFDAPVLVKRWENIMRDHFDSRYDRGAG